MDSRPGNQICTSGILPIGINLGRPGLQMLGLLPTEHSGNKSGIWRFGLLITNNLCEGDNKRISENMSTPNLGGGGIVMSFPNF